MNITRQSSRVLRKSLAFARCRRNHAGFFIVRRRDAQWQKHLSAEFRILFETLDALGGLGPSEERDGARKWTTELMGRLLAKPARQDE